MDRILIVFHDYFIDELGGGLKNRIGFFCYLSILFFISEVNAFNKTLKTEPDETARTEYYKYWNPYRRVLDLRGEPQSFFGQIYYQATFNKENRIRSVIKYGKDGKPKETYSLIWSRSGARSEYQVMFHETGNVSRLEQLHNSGRPNDFGSIGDDMNAEILVEVEERLSIPPFTAYLLIGSLPISCIVIPIALHIAYKNGAKEDIKDSPPEQNPFLEDA